MNLVGFYFIRGIDWLCCCPSRNLSAILPYFSWHGDVVSFQLGGFFLVAYHVCYLVIVVSWTYEWCTSMLVYGVCRHSMRPYVIWFQDIGNQRKCAGGWPWAPSSWPKENRATATPLWYGRTGYGNEPPGAAEYALLWTARLELKLTSFSSRYELGSFSSTSLA